MNGFQKWAAGKANDAFPCIDGASPAEAGEGAVWIYGLEPGYSILDQQKAAAGELEQGPYTVERQLKWPFNRGAFWLLSALKGWDPRDYRKFALEKRPFEEKSKGYVKANLYPEPAWNLMHWDAQHVQQTGFESKQEYCDWCRAHVFPLHLSWVEKYKPSLIYAAGHSRRQEFLQALAPSASYKEVAVKMKSGAIKKFFIAEDGVAPLVIGPHFTGGPDGLNSYEAAQTAAAICKGAMEQRIVAFETG